MKVTVVKSFSFDAAHWLPDYPGKCSAMHGHRWKVEIGVKGYADDATGMVVDFTVLKSFLEKLDNEFDHRVLNEVVSMPTAENLCIYIKNKFLNSLAYSPGFLGNETANLDFVRVWETEDSYAEVHSE